MSYMDGYRDIATVPHRDVRSWTTLDVDFSYTPQWHAGLFSDTTFSLSAENVLNRNPPFLNNAVGIGYDQENGDLTGRMVSLTVRKKW
jgi:outer membrane receptor protein involved in Fe transport